jgi:hypothetical protein
VKGLLSVKFIFVLAAPIVKQKKWHIETFGEEVLEGETPVLEAFVAEAGKDGSNTRWITAIDCSVPSPAARRRKAVAPLICPRPSRAAIPGGPLPST